MLNDLCQETHNRYPLFSIPKQEMSMHVLKSENDEQCKPCSSRFPIKSPGISEAQGLLRVLAMCMYDVQQQGHARSCLHSGARQGCSLCLCMRVHYKNPWYTICAICIIYSIVFFLCQYGATSQIGPGSLFGIGDETSLRLDDFSAESPQRHLTSTLSNAAPRLAKAPRAVKALGRPPDGLKVNLGLSDLLLLIKPSCPRKIRNGLL